MTDAALNVWFFGCWNEPGHYWHRPGRAPHNYADEPQIRWIDGGFAPRKVRIGSRGEQLVKNAGVCWCAEVAADGDRQRIDYDSEELGQGIFLRHVVSAPTRHMPPVWWTLISWWDRCQGDRRGACNSTLVVEGDRDTPAMVDILAAQYPHVLANLQRHGVALVQVIP